MPFDIYGDRLLPGHCEVHPWVHCEYPCPECIRKSEEERRMKAEEDAYWAGMAAAEYEAIEHGWYESIGFDPIAMGM